MNVRRRILSAACAAIAGGLLAAVPAGAATLAVQVPANAEIDKPANIVYSGMADAAGTVEVTGSGQNMTLRTFYVKGGGVSCSPTSAEQRARPDSKFDGDQFVESPAPYSLTSTITFAERGTYKFCAYLEIGQANDTSPPAAFAEAVLTVGGPPIPCVVPKLGGLSLVSATAKLKAAGCALGKVSKPRKVAKKAKLVVRSQSVAPEVKLGSGFKINVVLKVKGKKK